MAVVHHHRASPQLGSPSRPTSASPKKLQVYDEPSSQFGTSPKGSARQRAGRMQKFTLDHVGVDVPNDEYLREMFEFFDPEKTGIINTAEFRQLFQSSFENYGAPLTNKDLDRLFSKLDRGKTGFLNYDEFCVLLLSRLKM